MIDKYLWCKLRGKTGGKWLSSSKWRTWWLPDSTKNRIKLLLFFKGFNMKRKLTSKVFCSTKRTKTGGRQPFSWR